MSQRDDVIEAKRVAGDLWTPSPGLVGLRGETLSRFRALEDRVRALCTKVAPDWLVPPAIPLAVLQRAKYFASFPQWLTVASHLSDDPRTLERVAESSDVSDALEPPTAALPPAVCYHVYAALAESRLSEAALATAQGSCWRHEGARLAPLERGWAFTMRELVCVGTELECERFAAQGIAMVRALAEELEIDFSVEVAEDPFFAPTARGQAMLQRMKGLKRELRLSIGAEHTTAAASVNLHEQFFGEAFDIRTADGKPAFTACVAFGLERWLLASLVLDVEPARVLA